MTVNDTPELRETFAGFQVEATELSCFVGTENGTVGRELIVMDGR